MSPVQAKDKTIVAHRHRIDKTRNPSKPHYSVIWRGRGQEGNGNDCFHGVPWNIPWSSYPILSIIVYASKVPERNVTGVAGLGGGRAMSLLTCLAAWAGPRGSVKLIQSGT